MFNFNFWFFNNYETDDEGDIIMKNNIHYDEDGDVIMN